MPINIPNPSLISSLVTIGVNDSGSGTSGSNSTVNTSSQIPTNIWIGGIVLDPTGNPLSNVNIQFNQIPKTLPPDPTVQPGALPNVSPIIKPIVENITTNKDGEWSFVYPKTEIDLKSVEIIFLKQGYKPEQITPSGYSSTVYPNEVQEVKKISNSSTEPPYVYIVGNKEFKSNDNNIAKQKANDYYLKAKDPKFKGSTIINIKKTLSLAPKPEEIIQPTIQPIINEINELERLQAKEKNKQELPATAKVTLSIDIKKEQLKKKLIPFIIKLLLPFGVMAVQSIVNKIDLDKVKDQILCPRQDKILELIKKRNKLVKQINAIYKTVTTISKILVGINIAITAIQVGILAVTVIPFPVPAIVPSGIAKFEDELKKLRIVVNIITLTLAAFGAVLGIILRLLNALDLLLRECAQSQDVPFEVINSEINILVNQSTGVSNSQVINEENTYKGFTLELKLDEFNTSKYPKRFAQALNKQGIPVLKTDSSFASDPQVLLDQLKFIIDSNPQLTAE